MPVEHDMQMTDAEHLREYARQLEGRIQDARSLSMGDDPDAIHQMIGAGDALREMIYDLSREGDREAFAEYETAQDENGLWSARLVSGPQKLS